VGQQDFGGQPRYRDSGIFQQVCALEQRFVNRQHGWRA
jgi:hypothetical protein